MTKANTNHNNNNLKKNCQVNLQDQIVKMQNYEYYKKRAAKCKIVKIKIQQYLKLVCDIIYCHTFVEKKIVKQAENCD